MKTVRNPDGSMTVTANDGSVRHFPMAPISAAQAARNREAMDATHKFWNDAAAAEEEATDEDRDAS